MSATDITKASRKIPQSVFASATDYKFNLFWSEEIDALKRRVEQISRPFSNLFHSHEGIHSGNIRAKLFVSSKQGASCRPLIFGRDEIRPFGIIWGGGYVCYSEDIIDKVRGEYANLSRKEYFTNPKIFVRRTGDFVMAAVDRNGYFASNNLFVCVPIEECDLDYVTAILNSRLITWYFRSIQPRVGRLFAELKIVHLNTFPIRVVRDVRAKQLAGLSKFIKAKVEKDPRCDVVQQQQQINQLVYDIYDLTDKDIELVEANGR